MPEQRLSHVVNTRLTDAEHTALRSLAQRPNEPVAHILRRLVQQATAPRPGQRCGMDMTTPQNTAPLLFGMFTCADPRVSHGIRPAVVTSSGIVL